MHICNLLFSQGASCFHSQKKYNFEDFIDPTHLSSEGAVKFTSEVKDKFGECFE
jgi:hypothetical protein